MQKTPAHALEMHCSRGTRAPAQAASVVALLLVVGIAGADAPPSRAEPVTARKAPAVASGHSAPSAHGHYGLWIDSYYRSPGLAVALSLTPLPVDFGNLYAENLGWGVTYTAVELSLLAPMMWIAGSHMDHDRDDTRSWSDGERGGMIALVSGYVVVKIAAGIHAGYAASNFNQASGAVAHASVTPLRRGAFAQLDLTF